MQISFNISTPGSTQIQGADPLQQNTGTGAPDKTLTISITSGNQGGDGVAPTAITLSYPMIGPEDVALNEVMQDLKNLNLDQIKGLTLTAAALKLNEAVGDLAGTMVKGGAEYIKENKEVLAELFDKVETQAKKTETQLFDLINNSTYPDFNSFLGKMLDAAQELRQLASQAKHSLVLAEYNNVLDEAKQMEVAAQKNYESTMKDIEASKMEAIGKIVSGVVSIAATGAGTYLGGAGGRLMGAQTGAGVGGALGGIAEGSLGLVAAGDREQGALLKKEADLADAVRKKMEATDKLLGEAEQISDELRDIAKTLSDMVLKLYQDFISSQKEILQRANI